MFSSSLCNHPAGRRQIDPLQRIINAIIYRLCTET
jgi:hypothetical protein